VTRLLLLTPSELTRDPRARRAALAARRYGLSPVGLSGQISGADPLELDGVAVARLRRERVAPGLRAVGLGGMKRERPLFREARGIYRLLRLARLTVELYRTGRILGRFDVVHANDLDTLPAAWLLARASGARLVYDAHELYTEQEPDPPRLHRAVARATEGALARRADAVVTVSELIADELRQRLRLDETPTAVLNAPERDDTEPPPRADGPLRAIYQGAMGPGRPLEDLLGAAERAPEVQFTLRVLGASQDALRQAAAHLPNVEVVEPVPPDRLVAALHGHDVGLIINRPVTQNDELVFPNKLFEYLMAGLAVAVPRLPGMTPLVEGEGVGVTYEPGQPEKLGEVLTSLARDPEFAARMRLTARRRALERYNAEAQQEVLASVWRVSRSTPPASAGDVGAASSRLPTRR
jgi:glycosyltransferase involved in cell wall biosynthesis